MAGPVSANVGFESPAAVTSQRILWPKGGSSLEEVPETNLSGLDSRMYWPGC